MINHPSALDTYLEKNQFVFNLGIQNENDVISFASFEKMPILIKMIK